MTYFDRTWSNGPTAASQWFRPAAVRLLSGSQRDRWTDEAGLEAAARIDSPCLDGPDRVSPRPMIKSEPILRIAEQNPHFDERDVEALGNTIWRRISDTLVAGDTMWR